jgi:hypothetical protein
MDLESTVRIGDKVDVLSPHDPDDRAGLVPSSVVWNVMGRKPL